MTTEKQGLLVPKLITLIDVHRTYGYPRALVYEAAELGHLRVIPRGRWNYTCEAWVSEWLDQASRK